ncbi:hypothetical protein NA56DRAFT_744186 [Hyaloscypha hepaticicola]|uniref:HAT C-terminal dimerisation domain-containing protein n=1 Tax=Hyaloscypha hepaticicola TaxID=2082293 RepID=A0A2J6Q0K3_9HELO|nr:hypothetical protein NA56DRAFT_750531 [Hyaloscypha hepaticicola]PMD19817.1 hypothetical protein NA56DRAFT_750103 [Hyaloscypha hepaticicola]PMD26887.1 hypothetical protein NA56DRAFT_744186 [Hyaloscypha hepaticicola]
MAPSNIDLTSLEPSSRFTRSTSIATTSQSYHSTGGTDQDVIAEGSESEWPQLACMAFDFLAVPAMSSECEREDCYGIRNA